MKQLYALMIATAGTLAAVAQTPKTKYNADSLLSRWVIDVNLLGGLSSQNFTTNKSSLNYLNAVNANPGELKFKNGVAYGGDAQLGFFFGKKRHFGIGAGFMYLMQEGYASLNNYHVEYQAADFAGSTFRQSITGNDLNEHLAITNMNIPVMLKYKNRFSKRWGFTADAGALFNVQMKSAYKAHANFDYEAIYQLRANADGGTTAVYDNSPVPSVNDWLITKAEFLRNNPNGNMPEYFNTKRALGYSVGLNETVPTKQGNVSYNKGSIGFMLQPSFNYFLSDDVALNFGGYYMFQPFKNNATANYHLTDGAGNYSSMLNNATASTNQSYGLNIGARFFLGNKKDRDHDGITDRKDKCPDVFGLAKFDGCPDTDGDGIQDSEDSCVTVFGLARFHGCPDTDGDGIPDKDDLCPLVFGLEKYHGCPDRDGDGIIDKDDSCPDVFGLVQFHGCPDRDGDGVPDADDKCPDVAGPIANQGCPIDDVKTPAPTKAGIDGDISTPILFESDRSYVPESYIPEIDEAARQLKDDKDSYLTIDGHADTTGAEMHNEGLSQKRANAVKKIIVDKGVNASRIKTTGHGSDIPVAPNETPEGRQKNRRSVMKLVKTRYKN